MALKQKLIIDKELTNNIQIIVRDETGIYSASNLTGYGGGGNSNPISDFDKYIFELYNMHTNSKYVHIQSDNPLPNEYYQPSIAQIVDKYNVTIDADDYGILNFEDGLYRLSMTIKMKSTIQGTGVVNGEVITGVQDAAGIYNSYKYIVVGNEVYLIRDAIANTLVLDRPITVAFSNFTVGIRTSVNLIISDSINIHIDTAISKLSKSCGCSSDFDILNKLSEAQLYLWGIDRCVDKNDYMQAYEYFKLVQKICKSIRCNCDD